MVTLTDDDTGVAAVTLVVTVEAMESEPSGYLVRAMLRSVEHDVELIGPAFVTSDAALRNALAAACERMIELMRSV